MKKIFVLLILILLNINIVLAERNDKNYSIRFNGTKFNLLYSVKNKDFGGYLNEYYKKGDTYNIWSELVAVHHFPNAYSPIDRIRDFKAYLGSMHVPSSLTFDDKKNTAMIDFIMISDHTMPVVIEFNVFKYEKSKKCGSIAIQYARRYTATTTLQIESIKKAIEKNRKNLISKVKKLEIPELITKDIDKCISAADVVEKPKSEKIEEEISSKETPDEISNQNKQEITEASAEESKKEESTTKEAADEEKINKEIAEENKNTAQTFENNVYAKEEKVTAEKQETNDIAADNTQEKGLASVPTNKNNSTEIKQEEPGAVKEKTNQTKLQSNIIAPVPVQDKNNNVKNTRHKKNKSDSYEIANDKNDYIAEPRTKKELKKEIKAKKQKQKDNAKQAKIQAKADKKAAKLDKKNAKKQAKIDKKQAKLNKKQAKKAEKQANKPYTISNNNSDLIAKPRTKKELKKHNKQMQKKAKERAKQAKKKLNS